MNVKQLRQTAKAQYAQGKGRRDLKGYSRMGKAALLSKLGMHEEARAHKSQTTRRKAIAFNASKEGGDSSVRKAQIKGRILRSVKRGITAEEKKQGRKLTQEEKRTVAGRALAVEVKAIRSGTPESKPKRGGNHPEGYQSQKGSGQSSTNISEAERRHALNTSRDIFARTEIKNLDDWEKEAKSRKSPLSKDMKQASLKKAQQALTEKQATWQRVNDAPEQKAAQKRTNDFLYKSSFSHTPPPGVSVAEHRANLRRQYGATSGTRNENLSKKEERRSEIGRGDEGESRIRKSEVADRVTEPEKAKAPSLDFEANEKSMKINRAASGGVFLKNASGQDAYVGHLPDDKTLAHAISNQAVDNALTNEATFGAGDHLSASAQSSDYKKSRFRANTSKGKEMLRDAAAHIMQKTGDINEAVRYLRSADHNATTNELKKHAKSLIVKPASTVTRGTKAKPWSGNDAPTSTRSGRGEMVRGRSID